MKHTVTLRSFFFLSILLPVGVIAAPEVTGISGSVGHGNEIQIYGSGFGAKSPAKPYFWAPLETSINPSSLGIVTAWSEIGPFTFVNDCGPDGGGCLQGDAGNGYWTMRVDATGDFSWVAPGQNMYLYRKLKQNFSYLNLDGSEKINWKTWRLWGNILETSNRTSIYVSASNGGWGQDHSVESQQNLWPFNTLCIQGPVNQWKTDEFLLRSNTNALGRGDGHIQYKVNGVNCGEAPYQAWEGTRYPKFWDATTTPKLQRNYVVHGVKANYTMGPDDRYWATNVYLDTTWARVMIGNAPNFTESTQLEIQIPVEWTNSSIKVHINTRAFPAGQSAYLFVIDTNNNASAGFPLATGSLIPPSDLKVVQ